MARKTVDVTDVREYANTLLVQSPDSATKHREGVMAMVEHVLHLTGNYRGFNYNASEFASENDECDDASPVLRKGYDDTRRHYF